MNGPLIGELYFPQPCRIWCAAEMMHLKMVPAYAYGDFWRNKPRWSRWFYRLLSYLIAPVSVCVFNNAHTLPVYHDKRAISTMMQTVRCLERGENVLIFPEHDVPHNHIVCDFQEGFVDVARLYWKKTGKCLSFVPVYMAPMLHKAYLGTPIFFNPDHPVEEERRRICDALMETITQIAVSLPRHAVVPYNNIPRRKYGYNDQQGK